MFRLLNTAYHYPGPAMVRYPRDNVVKPDKVDEFRLAARDALCYCTFGRRPDLVDNQAQVVGLGLPVTLDRGKCGLHGAA